MAKIKIPFNGTDYSINESALASAKDSLKTHLETVMNGSGGGELEIAIGKTLTFKSHIEAKDLPLGADDNTGEEFYRYEAGNFSTTWNVGKMNGGLVISVNFPDVTYAYFDDISGQQFGMPAHTWFSYRDKLPLDSPPSIVVGKEHMEDGEFVGDSEWFETYCIQPLTKWSALFEGGASGSAGGDIIITLDGADYSVDSTKLSTATDIFVAHVETLAGGGGLEPITWDGVIGDRVTVTFDGLMHVKVSDTVFSADDLIGATISVGSGETGPVDESQVYSIPNVFTIYGEFVTSVADTAQTLEQTGLSYPETGTYFASGNVYIASLIFAGGSTGGDTKLTINGNEYPVDSAKLSDAIADLHEALGRLSSGTV